MALTSEVLCTQSRSYFLFAGLNFVWIPLVWLFYPETGFGRNLESLTHLFDAGPFNWQMENAYHRAIAENESVVTEDDTAAKFGEKV